uniref:Bestrophin homolog n=1 Tax=Schizaphis graminum TaxID=13262 RepID=A0A2S2P4R4_SCHGA
MTVSYSRLVANGSSFGCFGSILCKWRGSVYKLVWRELAAYLVVYFAINLAYRFAFTEAQQKLFIKIRCYLAGHSASVPLTFAMSFYVGLVVKRWWEQYRLLPWPDTLALFASAAIPGTTDERGRLMRRNIVRYAVLAYVITLKQVSIRVKKRFPTLQHIVDAGIMLESEKKIVEMMDERSPMSKYWMPLVWATNIINRARRESLISSDQVVQTLLVELSDIRRRLGSIISYDTVCVPLVYTQVSILPIPYRLYLFI